MCDVQQCAMTTKFPNCVGSTDGSFVFYNINLTSIQLKEIHRLNLDNASKADWKDLPGQEKFVSFAKCLYQARTHSIVTFRKCRDIRATCREFQTCFTAAVKIDVGVWEV